MKLFVIASLLIIAIIVSLTINLNQKTKNETANKINLSKQTNNSLAEGFSGEKTQKIITFKEMQRLTDAYKKKSVSISFDRVMYQELIDENKILKVKLKNQGFESEVQQENRPRDWFYSGQIEYVANGCFSGDRCLRVNFRQENKNLTQPTRINSAEIDVKPGTIYSINLKINCLHCEDESVYAALIFLRTDNRTDRKTNQTVARLAEFKRNILILENTEGYKNLSMTAITPETAEKMILGIRVQHEGAESQEINELYLDSE